MDNNRRNHELQQRDRRRLKIWMMLSVFAGVVAAAFSVLATRTSSMDAQSTTSEQVTKKTGCAIYEVDPEINPCDNFYQFACHKWQQENPRPNWSSEWSVDAIVEERITKTAIEILEEPDNDEDIKVISQAKDLYQKCLLNDGDHNSGDYFIENLWKTMGGMYGRSLHRGNIVPSRTEMCGALVHKRFQFALLHKILKHNYKNRVELERIITEVQAMFNSVKHAFDKTKSRSFIQTYEDFKLCAGYPKWIFNPNRVQAGYNWINLNKNQTFREQMVYITKSNGDLFDERFQDYECHMWHLTSENRRPKSYNELYLQMRVLESPFFDLSRSRAINYGSLGPVIASIMASVYIDWQSTAPMDCLEKQYSSFTVDLGEEDLSLNGKKTLRSNFEENVAVHEAYAAFSKMNREVTGKVDYTTSSTCKNKSRNQFTSDQLFFLGYAQSNCQILSKEEIKFFMERSSQSPSMFHVLGPLLNLKGFAKAWNCPLGSNMNPNQGDKCQVL